MPRVVVKCGEGGMRAVPGLVTPDLVTGFGAGVAEGRGAGVRGRDAGRDDAGGSRPRGGSGAFGTGGKASATAGG
jgi:hypothetical protein